MDDDFCALQKWRDLLHLGEIGGDIGFVRQEVFGGFADVGGDKLAAHGGERRAQLVAEIATGAGENDLGQHGNSFR